MPKQCTKCPSPVFSKGLCRFHWLRSEHNKPKAKQLYPIKRIKTVLVKKTEQKVKTQRIKRVSEKRAGELRLYGTERKKFLAKRQVCEVKHEGCKGTATDIHHMRSRMNKELLDVSLWLPVCRSCHTWIELNPIAAKQKGFSVSRLKTNNDI